MEVNPRAVFERLFGDGDSTDPAARLAAPARNSAASSITSRASIDRLETESRARATAASSASIWKRSATSSGASRRPKSRTPTMKMPLMERPSWRAGRVRRSRQADDGPAGDRLPDRHDARDHVHDRPRGQQPAATARSASPTGTTPITHHQNDPEKIAKVAKIDALSACRRSPTSWRS